MSDPFLTPSFRSSNLVAPQVRGQSASVIQIESSRLLPWMMLSCLLAGLALGLSAVTLVMNQTAYYELERESRLLQMQVDGMKVAMLAEGISLNRHLEGEAP